MAVPEPSGHEEVVVIQAAQAQQAPVAVSPEPAPAPQVTKSVAAEPQLKLDWPSDLVQIETDPRRVPAPMPEPVEQATPVRQRRPRLAPVEIAEESLVQVETRKPEATIGG